MAHRLCLCQYRFLGYFGCVYKYVLWSFVVLACGNGCVDMIINASRAAWCVTWAGKVTKWGDTRPAGERDGGTDVTSNNASENSKLVKHCTPWSVSDQNTPGNLAANLAAKLLPPLASCQPAGLVTLMRAAPGATSTTLHATPRHGFFFFFYTGGLPR